MMRVRFVTGLLSLALLIGIARVPAAAQPVAQPVIGLLQGVNSIVRFNSATPGTIISTVPVVGLAAGETLKAIDYRPANGLLYGGSTDGMACLRKRGSAEESHREAVRAWLAARPEVSEANVGPLIDVWYLER